MANKPQYLTPKIPLFAVDLDPLAFDNLIKTHGIKFKHYRAAKCPIGKTDIYDTREPDATCTQCSNGFFYIYQGDMTCAFTSNSEQVNQMDVGSVDGSNVQITVPRFYDNDETKSVYIIPFDRLYLTDESITVVNWQLAEYNLKNINKLRFPVERVEFLMDSTGKQYYENTDFSIQNGLIHWSKNHPVYNLDLSRGDVFTVVYHYRPYYYINRLQHEIRIGNVLNTITGERLSYRMGQSATITREYIFENQVNDVDKPSTDLRAARIPDNTFGDR